MEYAINNRLKQFLYLKRIREKELIEILGVSDSLVSMWFTNRRNFSAKHIFKLKQEFPDLNESWLLNGEEPMLLGKMDRIDRIEKEDDHFDSLDPESKQAKIVELQKKIIELQNKIIRLLEAPSDNSAALFN